ncbi:hypothetical protein [Orenia marismortui]|uniref:Sulfotransferase family protein n=1 Tax=Orenia marismortui TaxID=46469 RepID=A0A4R8HPS2_9FIRM|nr:hypothetical protein [Orenia marismortui]TDX58921.1 hypothetical protein C7959_10259 [Orenia marismortui]
MLNYNNITKYIHIGMPKNLSSTLQKYFFSKHPEIYHLGIGIDSLIDYIDEDVNVLFENYLMYSKDFEYIQKEDFYKDKISFHLKKAKEKKKKAFGVSLELLSFSFTPDMIDVTQKAKRLYDLFGKHTKIILIIRNQKSIIESMYREFIKIGYDKSYKEYIEFLFLHQSRSFLYDFFYENLIKLYSSYFGAENIEVFIIEKYRNKDGSLKREGGIPCLIKDISQLLNIKNNNLEIGHANPPLTNRELFQKFLLNKRYNHDLSNAIFEGADRHRLYKYYSHELNFDYPDPFHDVKIKRNLIEYSKKLAKNDLREIEYYADPKILKEMEKMFIESNRRLVKKYNIDLPECYFNMKF